jgi:hypothetical protein
MLHGYRMLNDCDALVLVNESYDAHLVILVGNLYTPCTLHALWLLRNEKQSISVTFHPHLN